MEKEDRNFIENMNKLSLPATILIASVVLGGFYYFSEVNKQRSIERQQEVKFAEERRLEEKVAANKADEIFQKALCKESAEEMAIDLYKDYCTSANYCTYKKGTFLTAQYESAYKRCLQGKGLE